MPAASMLMRMERRRLCFWATMKPTAEKRKNEERKLTNSYRGTGKATETETGTEG